MARAHRLPKRSDQNVPKGAGSQHVYEMVSRRILTLEFPPGTQLEEARLVELLGVSRTGLAWEWSGRKELVPARPS